MNRILSFSVCFLMLLPGFISVQAQNQYKWSNGQSAGYSYRFIEKDPTHSRYYVLKNGLTVILAPDSSEPRLQTIIATKAGSKTDPKDHTGLAHYLEHMLFKGTTSYGTLDYASESALLDYITKLYDRYKDAKDAKQREEIYKEIDIVSSKAANIAIANEYDKMMSMIGAKGTNAFTSFEQTAYINDIPSNYIYPWLMIEGERFHHPVFRLFHTELEAVYEEKNISLDSDENRVYEAMFAGLFKNHTYGTQTTIGTVEHLKRPSITEIRKYYNTYYVPNNMVVILSGNMNPDETIKLVDETFSWMKATPVPEYKFTPENKDAKPEVIDVTGPESESVSIAFRLPGATDANREYFEIMSDILANGTAGLFDLNLVNTQKVLSADAYVETLTDYSVLSLYAEPLEGQKLEEVKDLLMEQLEYLKAMKYDESLYRSVILNRKKQRMKMYESNAGKAYTLLDAFVTGRDWATTLNQEEAAAGGNAKIIAQLAETYLNGFHVVVYKRKGEPKDVVKVDKPPINPVEVNRDKSSAFVEKIAAMTVPEIKPVFIDYQNEIKMKSDGRNQYWYVENKTNELFDIKIVFEMGSTNNKVLPLAINYFEVASAESMSSSDIKSEFYKLACDFSYECTKDQTILRLSGLSENIGLAIKILTVLIKDIKPDEESWKLYVNRVITEREINKQDPATIHEMLGEYVKYDGKNPANDVLTNEELQKLSVKEIVTLLNNLFAYPHTVMYYGPAKSLPGFEIFSGMSAEKLEIPSAVDYQRNKTETKTVYYTNYDKVQTDIGWYIPLHSLTLDELAFVRYFNEYFGSGMSSLVFQDIRESKALAYSAYAYVSQPTAKNEPFEFTGYVGSQADKLSEAVQAMNQLITNVPFIPKNSELARNSLLGRLRTERTKRSAYMSTYYALRRIGIEKDPRFKIFAELSKSDDKGIFMVAKPLMSSKGMSLYIVGPKDKVNDAKLAGWGKPVFVSIEKLFGY